MKEEYQNRAVQNSAEPHRHQAKALLVAEIVQQFLYGRVGSSIRVFFNAGEALRVPPRYNASGTPREAGSIRQSSAGGLGIMAMGLAG